MKPYRIPKNRKDILLDLLGDVVNKSILDVGCAQGDLGFILQKKGAVVTGIDNSKESLKIAKSRLHSIRYADLNRKLPLKKNSFDIIIASEIIEHLNYPLSCLRELNRLLKQGGLLILSTPNFLYWGNRFKFLKGEFRYQDQGIFDKTHVHFYTYQTLLEDVEKSNFILIEKKHLYLGSDFFGLIKKRLPALFAYQFIVKCTKR